MTARMRTHAIEALLIAAALALQVAPIPRRFIEGDYANGCYAALIRTFVPLANAVPVTLGDGLLFGIVFGTIAYVALRIRRAGMWRVGLRVLAIVSALLVWFDAAWALNYRRAPVVARIAFDPARVDPAHVDAFARRIVAGLDATAPAAHAEREPWSATQAALARSFAPVVARLGDRWDVPVTRPKATLLQAWFAWAGIGGQWDPFAFETIVNSAFLPFEKPFAVAHEWGHVAGFGDESDANLIGALTCLRSPDPLVRYSGYFWAYGFLPENARRKFHVTRLVQSDLVAAQHRFLEHYQPNIYALQWFVYDRYLRVNRVTAGVVSYGLFVQVLVGTPLDAAGLPVARVRRKDRPE